MGGLDDEIHTTIHSYCVVVGEEVIGKTASESTGEMIGDDASEGGGNSYRAELGWVRDILVEAEEVGVGEERDDPAVDVT